MNIELLSPCGDMNALDAAINQGADAVYLGLSDFNARAKAENFNKENIRQAVRKAHLFGVKVYITLNTLIKDSEYERLYEMVKAGVDAKCDAFIIEDLGVAKFINDNFENVTLHASTQMGCNNLHGAKAIESLGFKRVVLARETRIEDIRLIRENTSLEIEYFIQGALCVSYSGNCYLSAFESGLSGNRGRCKQLCRFKYRKDFDNEGYYLSCRDLSLIDELEELIDAGVYSFKIEGRLRHEGYVAVMTNVYRKAFDTILKGGKFSLNDEGSSLMHTTFSRGEYTKDSYLYGTPDDIINKKAQNNTGIEIGKVRYTEKFKDLYRVTIESTVEVKEGDGLKFFYFDEEISSLGVGNVRPIGNNLYEIFTKTFIKKNSRVHLIRNKAEEDRLLSVRRRIELDVEIKALSLGNLMAISRGRGRTVSIELDFKLEKAQKSPITKEEIITQFDRFQDTCFTLSSIKIETDDVYLPKGVINQLRRTLTERMEEELLTFEESNDTAREKGIRNTLTPIPSTPRMNKQIILFDSLEKLGKHVSDEFIYCVSLGDFKNTSIIDQSYSLGIENLAIYMPMIMTSLEQDMFDRILDRYKDLIIIGNNVSALYYSMHGHRVIASSNMNVLSVRTYNLFLSLNMENVILSLESEKSMVLSNPNAYLYAYGKNSLMNFAHCPYKTINGETCASCTYDGNLNYSKMKLRRTRVKYCTFELLNKRIINTYGMFENPSVIDLRNQDLSLEDIVSEISHKNRIVSKEKYLGILDMVLE